MSRPRIVYLATADARGHLMRAQLLVHSLRAQGAQVDVLTTSDAGLAFFSEFGIVATLLSRHYAVQFDERQNMLRKATDAKIAAYWFLPSRMLRDVLTLRSCLANADLAVNDSFHPALLLMGALSPWRRKIVHIYGASLRTAVETNFDRRVPSPVAAMFRRAVAYQIERAGARLEHSFSYPEPVRLEHGCYRLPTPVAVADATRWCAGNCAAVYLNPHFRDPELAEALESAVDVAGFRMHAVGEGYGGRPRWTQRDPKWIDFAAASDLIISAPGMAALSAALVYRRPILLILTEQPEQRTNAAQAESLGLLHRVVRWTGDRDAFRQAVADACNALAESGRSQCAASIQDGSATASSRLRTWTKVLMSLSEQGSGVQGRYGHAGR